MRESQIRPLTQHELNQQQKTIYLHNKVTTQTITKTPVEIAKIAHKSDLLLLKIYKLYYSTILTR